MHYKNRAQTAASPCAASFIIRLQSLHQNDQDQYGEHKAEVVL